MTRDYCELGKTSCSEPGKKLETSMIEVSWLRKVDSKVVFTNIQSIWKELFQISSILFFSVPPATTWIRSILDTLGSPADIAKYTIKITAHSRKLASPQKRHQFQRNAHLPTVNFQGICQFSGGRWKKLATAKFNCSIAQLLPSKMTILLQWLTILMSGMSFWGPKRLELVQ